MVAPGPLSTIGVRELRNRVSSALRRAGEGERIIVTVDGKPAAQLGPLDPVSGATLWDLAGAGMVLVPHLNQKPEPPAPVPLPADVRVDRLLREIRGQ